MSRLSVFVIFVMTLIASVLSDTAQINTPSNQVQGSLYTITWIYNGTNDAVGSLLLNSRNNTSNVFTIAKQIKLSTQAYQCPIPTNSAGSSATSTKPPSNRNTGSPSASNNANKMIIDSSLFTT
ncbi:11431_t:CDS:2, partial [Ambispora leptoticha]